jgi:Na(+)/H(+) exchange regulatory cofactor NHE-RF2
MDSIPPDAPRPRLCQVIKRPDFSGYGFNLHAEKARPGQFIGKVDENSPAQDTGLKEGDRIIEVNGVNISQENHKQVVQRIKAVPNETKLLVVDKTTDDYYKKAGILVKSSLSSVWKRSSEPSMAANVTITAAEVEVNGNSLDEAVVPVVDNNHAHEEVDHSSRLPASRSSSSSVDKVNGLDRRQPRIIFT